MPVVAPIVAARIITHSIPSFPGYVPCVLPVFPCRNACLQNPRGKAFLGHFLRPNYTLPHPILGCGGAIGASSIPSSPAASAVTVSVIPVPVTSVSAIPVPVATISAVTVSSIPIPSISTIPGIPPAASAPVMPLSGPAPSIVPIPSGILDEEIGQQVIPRVILI